MVRIYNSLLELGLDIHERWNEFAHEYPNAASALEVAASALEVLNKGAEILAVGYGAVEVLHVLGVDGLGVAEHAAGLEVFAIPHLVYAAGIEVPEALAERAVADDQRQTVEEQSQMFELAANNLEIPDAHVLEARHAQERADLEKSIEDGREKLDSRLEQASSDTANTLRDVFEAAARERQDDVAARQAEEVRQLRAEQERDRDDR